MAFDFISLAGVCIVGGAGLLLLLYVVMTYNRLVALRNRVENAWAQIDVQLKRRYDLIPNLIETVKGYMKHEKETFENITKYRAQIVTGGVEDRAKANNMLSQTLKSLFAVAENYPNLKANETFLQLQGRISGIENELADRREFYNDSVNTYNIRIQSIPDRFVAGALGYTPEELFKAAEAERRDVEVKF